MAKMLSAKYTNSHYVKVIMLLNRLKLRNATCLFYDQVIKVLKFAYFERIPFENISGAVDHFINKKKYKKFSSTKSKKLIPFPHNKQIMRSLWVRYSFKDWVKFFPKQKLKLSSKTFKQIQKDKLPLVVELNIIKVVKNTWPTKLVPISYSLKARLCSQFVIKYIKNRSYFSPSIVSNPYNVLFNLYKYRNNNIIMKPIYVLAFYGNPKKQMTTQPERARAERNFTMEMREREEEWARVEPVFQ